MANRIEVLRENPDKPVLFLLNVKLYPRIILLLLSRVFLFGRILSEISKIHKRTFGILILLLKQLKRNVKEEKMLLAQLSKYE